MTQQNSLLSTVDCNPLVLFYSIQRELCDCLEQCLYSLHCVEYLTNIAPDELDVSHTPLVMEALSFNSGLESGNQIATCILKVMIFIHLSF